MNEKKISIIENAIGLFATKGFYSTSIQEIADESGVSKGSVYSHFRSKDELMVETFRYYFSKMRERLSEVEEENLDPKEKFTKQLHVYFEEVLHHKEFIIMQMREQALSLNKEVEEFLTTMKYETHQWYEATMIQIYGDKIKPYVIDGSILLEGIRGSFLQLLITSDVEVDLSELSSFVVRRLDDLMRGMLNENKKPLLTETMFQSVFAETNSDQEAIKKDVTESLSEMQKILTDLPIKNDKTNELQGAIDLLMGEIKKQQPQLFIFKGMLSNFKGIGEFDKYRKFIAKRLNIQLL